MKLLRITPIALACLVTLSGNVYAQAKLLPSLVDQKSVNTAIEKSREMVSAKDYSKTKVDEMGNFINNTTSGNSATTSGGSNTVSGLVENKNTVAGTNAALNLGSGGSNTPGGGGYSTPGGSGSTGTLTGGPGNQGVPTCGFETCEYVSNTPLVSLPSVPGLPNLSGLTPSTLPGGQFVPTVMAGGGNQIFNQIGQATGVTGIYNQVTGATDAMNGTSDWTKWVQIATPVVSAIATATGNKELGNVVSIAGSGAAIYQNGGFFNADGTLNKQATLNGVNIGAQVVSASTGNTGGWQNLANVTNLATGVMNATSSINDLRNPGGATTVNNAANGLMAANPGMTAAQAASIVQANPQQFGVQNTQPSWLSTAGQLAATASVIDPKLGSQLGAVSNIGSVLNTGVYNADGTVNGRAVYTAAQGGINTAVAFGAGGQSLSTAAQIMNVNQGVYGQQPQYGQQVYGQPQQQYGQPVYVNQNGQQVNAYGQPQQQYGQPTYNNTPANVSSGPSFIQVAPVLMNAAGMTNAGTAAQVLSAAGSGMALYNNGYTNTATNQITGAGFTNMANLAVNTAAAFSPGNTDLQNAGKLTSIVTTGVNGYGAFNGGGNNPNSGVASPQFVPQQVQQYLPQQVQQYLPQQQSLPQQQYLPQQQSLPQQQYLPQQPVTNTASPSFNQYASVGLNALGMTNAGPVANMASIAGSVVAGQTNGWTNQATGQFSAGGFVNAANTAVNVAAFVNPNNTNTQQAAKITSLASTAMNAFNIFSPAATPTATAQPIFTSPSTGTELCNDFGCY